MRLPAIFLSVIFLAATPAIGQAAAGQPFRVFFDWAKPELTRDAQATLDEVAAAYQQLRPVRVEIAAHTDRSGSASHNLAISRVRAETVKAQLAAKGIPAGAMAVAAHGESRPIVPTEDGVREAQNRRVEIRFLGIPSAGARTASLLSSDGTLVGNATLDGDSLAIEAKGLATGLHGLHLHAVGRCDGPDFASAGPHGNPTGRKHGSQNPQGPHMGDLPNLAVGMDGRASLVIKVPEDLWDEDGAALVIHALPDDYRTDPSGNSGARIACAAFAP